MPRVVAVLCFALAFYATVGQAAVELGLAGEDPPTVIRDVYLRDDTVFLAVADILPPLGLNGEWDTGRHLYRIHGKSGDILLSPASSYLRFGGKAIALKQKPRFIDEALRVPEEVVTVHLPRLLGLEIVYRSLDTAPVAAKEEEAPDAAATETAPPLPHPELRILRQISIDPGHGGVDAGGISPGGDKEKDLALALAQRLAKLFRKENDLPVVLTRDADYAVPLARRSPEGAGWPEENLLLSLHLGAWHNPEAQGCTIFIPPLHEGDDPADDTAEQLAQLLGRELTRVGLPLRGIIRYPVLPLSNSLMPGVLLEIGYLSNPDDLRLLRSEEGQERIARALYQGVRNYAQYLKETP